MSFATRPRRAYGDDRLDQRTGDAEDALQALTRSELARISHKPPLRTFGSAPAAAESCRPDPETPPLGIHEAIG